MQQYNQKLDTTDIFQTVIQTTMVDDLINNLVSYPTLHALKVQKGSFEDRHQYDEFIRNLPGFHRNLHHYFVLYCQKSRQLERLKQEHVSIKGYYVENKDFDEAAKRDELIIIYAELKPLTNKDSVLGLYHWEDKLNELRTSSDTDGVQRTSGNEGDNNPF